MLPQKPAWLAGIFIGTEEQQLTHAFGKQYKDYLAGVDRLVPLKKPYEIIAQREKNIWRSPEEIKLWQAFKVNCSIQF